MNVLHPTLAAAGPLDPEHLIDSFGAIGLFVIIFLESCFAPLPGDSLLFTAGLLASLGRFDVNIWVICIGCSIAGIAGNQAGYWFGQKAGTALYSRPNSRIFKQEHLEKTHSYFERFGPKTIVLARFIPVVRGLAPIVAGVGRMRYRVFVTYNVVGGLVWVFGFVIGGWFLGEKVPNVDKYILPLVLLVIVVTSIPVAFEYFKAKRHFAGTPSGSVGNVLSDEIRPD